MLWLLVVVFLAGAVGGIVNALISDNGFVLPKGEISGPGGEQILRPGFLGNLLIGGVAAGISWGLYGPLSAQCVVGCAPAAGASSPGSLSLASLVGATLVGVGGARWLTNEVDKRLLKAAANNAALGSPSPANAARMSAAPPAEALQIARAMSPR